MALGFKIACWALTMGLCMLQVLGLAENFESSPAANERCRRAGADNGDESGSCQSSTPVSQDQILLQTRASAQMHSPGPRDKEAAPPTAETASAASTSGAGVSGAAPQQLENDALLQVVTDADADGAAAAAEPDSVGILGFPSGGDVISQGLWCQVENPPSSWQLKSCPTGTPTLSVRFLTYNLFWWNLFDRHHGSDRSAGRLIADTSFPDGYDVMGFQECDDIGRVMWDARASGLQGWWETIDGGHAIGLAYRADRFELLEKGTDEVGEDDPSQHYGRRSAQWVRLKRHGTDKTIFFVNHHGPLPVNFDHGCAGVSTAANIVKVIANHAHANDGIVLVGDFNSQAGSPRIKEMDKRLVRVYTGSAFGGVDHIYSNCPNGAEPRNLGPGKGVKTSDHDALSVTFHF